MALSNNLRMVLGALGSLAICVPASIDLRAQVAGGTITGTIVDQSGAVVPSGNVSIKNLATAVVRTAITNHDGVYSVPNLLPGSYEVAVTAPGFKTQVQTGITLTVGATELVNLSLSVGNAAEKVDVSAAPPSVDLATSAISEVVNETTVQELPLNGRSWTDLAVLQPGVASVRTEQTLSLRAQHGFGTEMTISGGRPQQNNYRLNGISINDYSNAAPGSVVGVAMGVDSIQEFSVLISNYSAEYGRTSGGVVNAVTRSGTNQIHGDVYEFLRNSALDARNFFDKTIPPFKRNQFGAAVGGPIRKNRTFFFFDYEGLRQSLGFTQISNVPSAAARAGNLTAGTVAVDPVVARYLSAFYPLPNGNISGNVGTYSFAGQQVTPENYYIARVDHKFSEKDTLFGSYFHDSADTTQPDEFNNKQLLVNSGQQVATLEEDHVFGPTLFNSARIGYNRSLGATGGVGKLFNPALSDLSYGFVPGLYVGSLVISGVTMFTGGANADGLPQFRSTNNSFQYYDDVIWTKGNHSLKFGASAERLQANSLVTSWPGSQISFGSLSNFLTNQPLSITAVVNPSSLLTERGTRQTIAGAYVQDDWRWLHNLTINLGLRYEVATVPTEVQGKLSTLLNLTDAQPHLGNPYFRNPTLHNFEPRIGFAWDPFGNGKTSIRSSFGIFDVLPLPYLFEILTPYAEPFFEQANSSALPAGSFPTGAYQIVAANPKSLRVSYIEPNPKRDYVMTWNVNVQRQVLPHLTMTLAYVGSRGVHQPWTNNDADMVLPTLTPQGYLWPSPATSQRLNPNFGRIALKLWQSNSFYDGLQFHIKREMSHGFQLGGSYTWSKSIDTSSASEADNSFANSISNPLFFAPGTNRGLSDFNVGQVLVVNAIWQVPAPGFQSTIAKWALGGWEVGGIYSASTGIPFTAVLAGDPAGMKNNSASDVPNLVSSPGCDTLTNPGNPTNYIKTQCFSFPNPVNLFGNLGRNTLIGPSLSNLDFSLFKNNRIRESFNAQFRFEVFNILNHTNFAAPLSNDTVFDAQGNPVPLAGKITATQTTSRQIQFALKLTW